MEDNQEKNESGLFQDGAEQQQGFEDEKLDYDEEYGDGGEECNKFYTFFLTFLNLD